jgi:hypothetical protein
MTARLLAEYLSTPLCWNWPYQVGIAVIVVISKKKQQNTLQLDDNTSFISILAARTSLVISHASSSSFPPFPPASLEEAVAANLNCQRSMKKNQFPAVCWDPLWAAFTSSHIFRVYSITGQGPMFSWSLERLTWNPLQYKELCETGYHFTKRRQQTRYYLRGANVQQLSSHRGWIK